MNLDKVLRQEAESEAAKLKEVNEIAGDKWTIVIPKTRIHTLEQLLRFCEVDRKKWEVERFIVNKWEMGYKDAAKSPGVVPLYQVKAFLRRKRFETLEQYAKDNTKLRTKLEKMRLELNSERDISRRLARNHAGHDDLLKNISDVTAAMGSLSVDVSPAPSHRQKAKSYRDGQTVRHGHSEDAVFVWSDHHFSDVIRQEDTSGFPEYDLEIAGNRFGYVVEKAKQILTLHRLMYPINRLYIPILGDIANGTLWDAPQSNELFLPAQIHFSVTILAAGIQDMLQLVDAKVVDEIVLLFSVGNHTRIDADMPKKYQAQRTLDWLIYRLLIDRFKGDKRVKIMETMSPFIFQDIRGHRYLFAHGLQVGYKNKIERQARSISQFTAMIRALFDSPVYRNEAGLEGETFSRAVIGDIHVPVSFPRLKSNGSLNGQNELGVNWGLEPIPAGQQIFGVSKSHIETWGYFIDCTRVQRKHPNGYALLAKEYAAKFGRH